MEGIGMSKDSLCHIDRLGLARRTDDVCAVCGKTFYRTSDHVYKHYRKSKELFECSWTCYRAMERKIEQEGGKYSKVVFADYSDDDGEKEQISRIDFCKAKIEHYMHVYETTKDKVRKSSARKSVGVWKRNLMDAELAEEKGRKRT